MHNDYGMQFTFHIGQLDIRIYKIPQHHNGAQTWPKDSNKIVYLTTFIVLYYTGNENTK